MIYSYIEIGLKPAVVWLPTSSANCTRELFKASNELASFLVCTLKKILVGVADFL